jgi:hypothetical protein
MQITNSGVLVDSEAKENVIRVDAGLPSTHCVLIVEPDALQIDDPAPLWRVSVDITIRDPGLGLEPLVATLPTVMVGPVMHRRQVAAIARYPGFVAQWAWRFESDAGRARARVWLHPGESVRDHCGIIVLPSVLVDLGKRP